MNIDHPPFLRPAVRQGGHREERSAGSNGQRSSRHGGKGSQACACRGQSLGFMAYVNVQGLGFRI
jgi:hypothetical protein